MRISKAHFSLLVLAAAMLLIIPGAIADIAVTLGTAVAEGGNATFTCSAESVNDTISKTELYIGINALGLNQTDAACGGKTNCTSNFNVAGLQEGTWSWNCKAYNANNEGYFSPANGSLTITTLLEVQASAGPPSEPPAQPPSEPPATPPQQDAARCGDGACNGQEDCASCAQDCKCEEGTVCNKNGRCEKKSSLMLYLLIVFIAAGIAGFFLVKAKMRNKKEIQAEEKQQAVNEPVQQPEAAAPLQEAKPVEPQQEVQMPPEPQTGGWEPSTPYEENRQAEQANEPQLPEETPVQQYIRQMRQKGKTDLEISQKLRNSGWKDYEIAMALLTMKKEKPQKQR
jgi:hypothetical protein